MTNPCWNSQRSNAFDDYSYYVDFMRHSIQANMIVAQVQDQINRGLGAPDLDDMKRYAEEANAVAELWLETLPE